MNLLRVLDSAQRPMQRLGFGKYVASRCASTSTSSLETLGHGLVETVRRKVTVPLTPQIYTYARRRLTDRAYAPLKQTLSRLGPDFDAGHTVRLEIQDVYLAPSQLPSQSGKLVDEDWRKYPPLLLALGLIKPGTYSLMVAGLALLRLTPPTEIAAFGSGATPADETQMLARLYAAYNELKSPLGYAPIKETALLAGIRALVNDGLRFEIAEATELLKRTQRELPYVIRFNIDRMGNLVYVKFLADPISRK